jgi:hypothetical protein
LYKKKKRVITKAITDDKSETESHPNHLQFGSDRPKRAYILRAVIDVYYQDVIIVTMKGLEAKLEKILTIFNSLDFS